MHKFLHTHKGYGFSIKLFPLGSSKIWNVWNKPYFLVDDNKVHVSAITYIITYIKIQIHYRSHNGLDYR